MALINISNLVFTCLFTVEFIFKIIIQKLRYFKNAYNNLDFLIMLLSIADTLFSFFFPNTNAFRSAKALRMGRIFKLARQWDAFRYILLAMT